MIRQDNHRIQPEGSPFPLAPWEVRIGELRVYYDIEEAPEQMVYIRAVGIKEGNRVRIADEVIEL